MEDSGYTRETLAEKVEWEGGIHEAITGYGMSAEVLPSDAPEAVRKAWERIYATRTDAELIGIWLDNADQAAPGPAENWSRSHTSPLGNLHAGCGDRCQERACQITRA